jgi:hypothetical protein
LFIPEVLMIDQLQVAVDEVFAVDADTALAALLLPAGRAERRARIALHLCLERAADLTQLLSDVDRLAIHLCAHDDATGTVLLAVGDAIREGVA